MARKKQSRFVSRVKQIAKSAMKNQSELKRHNSTPASAVNISTTPLDYDTMLDVAKGTGSDDRIGDKVQGVGLKVNWNFLAGDDTNVIRLIVFSANTNADAPADVDSPPSGQFLGHAKILRDMRIALNETSGSATGGQKVGSFFVPYRRVIGYKSTDATPSLNPLRIRLLSDSAAVLHPVGTVATSFLFRDP